MMMTTQYGWNKKSIVNSLKTKCIQSVLNVGRRAKREHRCQKPCVHSPPHLSSFETSPHSKIYMLLLDYYHRNNRAHTRLFTFCMEKQTLNAYLFYSCVITTANALGFAVVNNKFLSTNQQILSNAKRKSFETLIQRICLHRATFLTRFVMRFELQTNNVYWCCILLRLNCTQLAWNLYFFNLLLQKKVFILYFLFLIFSSDFEYLNYEDFSLWVMIFWILMLTSAIGREFSSQRSGLNGSSFFGEWKFLMKENFWRLNIFDDKIKNTIAIQNNLIERMKFFDEWKFLKKQNI